MFFSRYGCIVGALAAVAAVSLWANTAQTTESDPVDQGVSGQPQPNTDIVQPSDAHPPKSPLRLSTIDYQDAGDKPGKLTVAGVALPGRELSSVPGRSALHQHRSPTIPAIGASKAR